MRPDVAGGFWRMSQEDLVCPSCRKLYDLPLLLPCSHSLCRTCIHQEKKMAASANCAGHSQAAKFLRESCSIYCPGCHSKVELPSPCWEAAMAYLPVNWAVKDLLERSLQSSKEPIVQEDCKEQDILEWELQEPTVLGKGSRTHKETLDTSGEAEERSLCSPPTGNPHGWCWETGMEIDEEEIELSLIGLRFQLDASTSHPLLNISHSGLQVTYMGPNSSSCIKQSKSRKKLSSVHGSIPSILGEDRGDAQKTPQLPQVMADVSIKGGLFYWEVDVCNCRAYRIGVCVNSPLLSAASHHSWCLERLVMGTFRVLYGDEVEELDSVPPLVQRIGVSLNFTGGTLSFYSAITEEHLVTLPISFPCPVRPFFYLTQGKLIISSGLPVPDFVFTSKASAYRAAKGQTCRWQDDLMFRPISPFIERFESLGLGTDTADHGLDIFSKVASLCTRSLRYECEAQQDRPK